jgi:hypothetical protein
LGEVGWWRISARRFRLDSSSSRPIAAVGSWRRRVSLDKRTGRRRSLILDMS